MRRLYGQRAEQANTPIDLDPDDAQEATAIPNAKQIEAVATREIGNGKLGFSQKRLDFRIEAYGFGTHFPWPLTFDITGAARLHRAASVLMDGLGVMVAVRTAFR